MAKPSSQAASIIKWLRSNPIGVFVYGNYDLKWGILQRALEEFIVTGQSDLIERHQEWTVGDWKLEEYKKEGRHQSNPLTLEELYKLKFLKEFWKDKTNLDTITELLIREESKNKYPHLRKKGFTQALKNECKSRDGYQCVICKSSNDLEVDHIRPLIHGGNNNLNNLQTLCQICHLKKTKLDRTRK